MKAVEVALKSCKGWTSDGGKLKWPGAINFPCPSCASWATFPFQNRVPNPSAYSQSGSSNCPNCSAFVQFFLYYDKDAAQKQAVQPASILMVPAPAYRFAIPNYSSEMPPALKRSMEDTVRAFNAGLFSATATSGRRTLEGIFKYLLPEDDRNQSLYKLIEAAKDSVDFVEPLDRLANAVRSGGNIGAHFDLEKEPTKEIAGQIVELLLYLISYLYELPAQITELEDSLNKKAITK